jgi:hypothetical protein
MSPFPGRGAAPEDYIAQADTTMQQLPGVIAGMNLLAENFNQGAGVLSLGYLKPVPYAAGISMTLATQTVEYAGITYAPILDALPFTASGVFEVAQFRVIQGITGDQLAQPNAADQVGFSANSNVGEKLREISSISDKGGAGDYDPVAGTGTNCIYALTQLIAGGIENQVVRLPAIPGARNNYLFSFPTGYTVVEGSVVIDADPGVTFYVDGVVFACEFVQPTKQVTLPLPPAATPSLPMACVVQPGGARSTPDESRKSRWLNTADIIAPVHRMVDPRTGWKKRLLTWPGAIGDGGDGAGVGETTKIFFDASSVVINASSGEGALHAAYTRLMVGDELSTRLDVSTGSAGFIPAVIVRSLTEFSGTLLTTEGATWFKKRIGSALAQGAATPPGMAQHQSYSPFTSIVTVRLVSPYRYIIMINGMVIYEGRSADPIQEIGLGGYISEACIFRWTDIFMARGNAPAAARLVGLFVIGDSLSMDQQGCWARWCRSALDATLGVRVAQYRNQAVGGQDSSAQLAILRAQGVPAGTTHTGIQIGTNNTQGLGPVAQLTADVSEMFDILEAAGSQIVLSLPPLWYTQGQAGLRGQASLRYAEGTPYRIALIKLCAARRVPILDSLPAYGPMLANFVNPLLVPNLTALNPMVFDNIHPEAYMAKTMGYSIAGLLLGQMAYVGTNEVPWTDLPSTWPVQNNWVLDPADGGQFLIAADGARRFRANYSTGVGATLADGTTVHQLGPLLMPSRPVPVEAFTPAGQRLLMILGVDGQLKIYGAAGLGATQVYVDSGRYEIA